MQLEPILGETNGMVLYQEQVMRISAAIGGISLSGADPVRVAPARIDVERPAKKGTTE